MRVKLSKLLSAVLAICIVFVGFTAFAAETVTITTTYDCTNRDAEQLVTVNADVAGLAANKEVTFLVGAQTINNGDDIVYINQETTNDSGAASFHFTDAWNEITSAHIRFGSDAGFKQDKFQLNSTVNRWSTAEPLVTENSVSPDYSETMDEQITEGLTNDGTNKTYAFIGQAMGPVSEYGIKLTLDGKPYYLPAMGSDIDGNFVIVVNNLSESEAATAKVYGK